MIVKTWRTRGTAVIAGNAEAQPGVVVMAVLWWPLFAVNVSVWPSGNAPVGGGVVYCDL